VDKALEGRAAAVVKADDGSAGGDRGRAVVDAAAVGVARSIVADAGLIGRSTMASLHAMLAAMQTPCPHCGAVTSLPYGTTAATGLREPHPFNLLFTTTVGPSSLSHSNGSGSGSGSGSDADGAPIAYLRPETAQGVYANFINIMASVGARRGLPLGVAQVGKSFRNEIGVGPFLFRTREFEQMEVQYFCAPESSHAA